MPDVPPLAAAASAKREVAGGRASPWYFTTGEREGGDRDEVRRSA